MLSSHLSYTPFCPERKFPVGNMVTDSKMQLRSFDIKSNRTSGKNTCRPTIRPFAPWVCLNPRSVARNKIIQILHSSADRAVFSRPKDFTRGRSQPLKTIRHGPLIARAAQMSTQVLLLHVYERCCELLIVITSARRTRTPRPLPNSNGLFPA